jgi:hypothetical protein
MRWDCPLRKKGEAGVPAARAQRCQTNIPGGCSLSGLQTQKLSSADISLLFPFISPLVMETAQKIFLQDKDSYCISSVVRQGQLDLDLYIREARRLVGTWRPQLPSRGTAQT